MTALIPVNMLDRAKGRLAAVLDRPAREALALATLRTVLAAAEAVCDRVVVLTADPRVSAHAAGGRVTFLAEDPEREGLNAQLEFALESMTEAPGGVLILHADLPLATADRLAEVLSSVAPAPSVTLVRSNDGGTNAMVLRPPGRFALAYGVGSFDKHVRAATAAGFAVTEVLEPALGLDLDTPADIEAFLALPRSGETEAGRVLIAAGFGMRPRRA
ncbi:MAG: 2-phospho-L-lactate guanylyltransferase [Chloroflexi bacterium]|nr:2-phospho-L-lactate guanylyltransferase [Chloroflexota bacterium]